MPRYFFHVRDGREFVDREGTELSDLNEARRQAVRLMGHLLSHNDGSFWREADWHMEVTNETGLTLLVLDIIGTEAPTVGAKYLDVHR